MDFLKRIARLAPGVLLCVAVTMVAVLLQKIEERATGQAYLEAIVLAILLGAITRTIWAPGERWLSGVQFAAKPLLEFAVMLLGASVSATTVLAMGPSLLIGIVLIVALSIPASYGVCRALGLPRRMAILVSCGNSICGNSAIAAVAPVIEAKGDEIASSIAFTAVLGVAVVLGLPLLAPVFNLSQMQYGALAGLTVYAVPQVLAATLPIGALANQIGTVVKLVRVLMLGPVILTISLMKRRFLQGETGDNVGPRRRRLGEFAPWFIVAFLIVATFRTLGLIPAPMLAPTAWLASALTTVSMAALGLGVDVRVVARAGLRVSLAVTVSLILLGAMSLGLILGLRVL